MAIVDQNALEARALRLGALTGLHQVRVTLDETVTPPRALLDVKFWNANVVGQIAVDPTPPDELFPIFGGHRVPGGAAPGMVRVTSIAATAAPDTLRLVVEPVGDFSTYTLNVHHDNIDPLLDSVDFKFRPGCFSIDCAPEWKPAPAPLPSPAIDSLARDYDSFRHALIIAMQRRVPGWQPTSDADLSVTLLDLFSAAADELADYQDRVMNEAYLVTARNRVSLARHARLVDYQVHQGNQASTVLAFRVAADQAAMPAGLVVGLDDPSATIGTKFVTIEPAWVLVALNDISLYTWDDTQPALGTGDTMADLSFATVAMANAAIERWTSPSPARLLIAEELDPRTGGIAGRNPDKRQVVRVTGAEIVADPVNPTEIIVRVTWHPDDGLRRDYCFVETPVTGGAKVRDICRFHGNLVSATSGTPVAAEYVVPEGPPPRWGLLFPLPVEHPLLYLATPPDGTTPPRSTLVVTVEDLGGNRVTFEEQINLVHSGRDATHFAVETDELLRSTIRFGTKDNGRVVPSGSIVRATWRAGLGLDGNLGRDRLTSCADINVLAVWNPFDAVDGRAPELADEVKRNAPESFRQHQLRAVTLADYVARAEEVEGVSRAAAAYLWTGSWRTVRVTLDPKGTEALKPELVTAVAGHLEALRMIGEDLEIRPPVFVPLRIDLVVCVRPDVWPEAVRFAIENELSTGWTDDGRRGLFHPDAWTFGQSLYVSEIAGRLHRVSGVEHISKIEIFRWDAVTPGDGRHVEVGPSEIIQVRNDPDHMELGFIDLELVGGRQ